MFNYRQRVLGYAVLIGFCLLLSNSIIVAFIFPSPRVYLVKQETPFIKFPNKSVLYVRGTVTLPPKPVRVNVKMIGENNIWLYINGKLAGKYGNYPITGAIIDVSDKVRPGKNVFALRVLNSKLKGDKTAKISILLWYVDGKGNCHELGDSVVWKAKSNYPIEQGNGIHWYDLRYIDIDWEEAVYEDVSSTTCFPSSVNPLLLSYPLKGSIIAARDTVGNLGLFSKDFFLGKKPFEAFIRCFPYGPCRIIVNGSDIIQINEKPSFIKAFSIGHFVRKGDNNITVVFQNGNEPPCVFLDAIFVSKDGAVQGYLSTDPTWEYLDPVANSPVMDIGLGTNLLVPIRVAAINPSFSVKTKIWVRKAACFLLVGCLVFLEAFVSAYYYRSKFSDKEGAFFISIFAYLLPGILLFITYIISRDVRVVSRFWQNPSFPALAVFGLMVTRLIIWIEMGKK